MAKIRNRDDFKKSILLRLGEPVVNLVVQQYGSIDCAVTATTGSSGSPTHETSVTGSSGSPTQETSVTGASGCPQIVSSTLNQLDLVIDDALDYFKNASSGSSNEKDVLLLELQEGKSVYKVCDDVLAIEQPLFGSNTSDGLGYNFDTEESNSAVGLFSWQSTFGSRGIYGLIGGKGYDNLLTTEIALEYSSLVQMRYLKKWEVQFNEYQKQLIIFPTPRKDNHKEVIAMITTREVPDEHCFKDGWLAEYAVALLSIQVGRNTSMFTGMQLPGSGGEYNSQFYYDNGVAERDRLREELITGQWGNNEPMGGFYTG